MLVERILTALTARPQDRPQHLAAWLTSLVEALTTAHSPDLAGQAAVQREPVTTTFAAGSAPQLAPARQLAPAPLLADEEPYPPPEAVFRPNLARPAASRYPGLAEPPLMSLAPSRQSAPVAVHLIAIACHFIGVVLMLAAAASAFILAKSGDFLHAGRHTNWGKRRFIPHDLALIKEVGPPAVAVAALIGLLIVVLACALQRGRRWSWVVLWMLNTLFAITVFGLPIAVPNLILINTRATRSWFRCGGC